MLQKDFQLFKIMQKLYSNSFFRCKNISVQKFIFGTMYLDNNKKNF